MSERLALITGQPAGPRDAQDVATTVIQPRWLTVRQAAQHLGYSLSKTKMLVATRQLRSLKDGGSRRILPEWVEEYVQRRVQEAA
ncbi:excisionase family DNA-binding protein [Lentzea cavernae]|uniref:Helix-turn-helix domain-containing protein n=1 Tax=Lentzea cavernae TaxID=2020703 RepID=A0ABQ3MIF3_9PSEU|nr:excisionase family DNA-binding protein [Lentzea cavernae]GHH43977.1 hypothetical protein GCM10017774_42630 [Lentzea cavernae]